MTSSDPNTASSSRDGVVPRASYVGLDPRPLRHGSNFPKDLRSQLCEMRYNGRRFIAFLSILLGDDEVLEIDEGVTGNKRVKGRGVRRGTDHDPMQLRGGELAYPTTTLWLPANLKNRGATLGYKDAQDFLNDMKKVLREVLKFGERATHAAKAFARMEFYLVEHVFFKVEDLRVALQALVKGMETKLPLMDPLLPDIVPSDGFVPTASYILEPQPPRVGSDPGSDAGDLSLQLRTRFYDTEQFYIFVSILLGEDQPPDENATVHYSGGALSVTGDSLQPHGAPTRTVWLPEYLEKREATPGYTGRQCSDQLIRPYREVMKFGARATDVAKAFARMKIEHVEYLLQHPDDLRSALQGLDAIAEDEDTRELIKMFMPDLETEPETDPDIDIPLDALPNELLPDVEQIDDDYIKLSVFHYFGEM